MTRPCGSLGTSFKDELLHSPRRDLRYHQFVRIPAVDLVHRTELAELLARRPELAEDRPVELHLIDLAADGVHLRAVGIWVRVRAVEILVRTRRNTQSPRGADVIVDRLQGEVVVEHLDARVAAVPDIHI